MPVAREQGHGPLVPVALSRDGQRLLVQERSILQMLHHPNIVRVHDLLTVGDSLGLVMEPNLTVHH